VNFDEEFEEEVKRNPAFRFDAPITSARVVRCARIIAHWANDRNKARDARVKKLLFKAINLSDDESVKVVLRELCLEFI
jgi:hypothetical protein